MERHNRKSHLAPQLSPSTQTLLRGDGIASPYIDSSATKTPTSGDIPIGGGDVKPPMPTSIPPEANGSEAVPTSSNGSYDRSAFPPRTSSSGLSNGRPQRDADGYPAITVQGRNKENNEAYGGSSAPSARSKESHDGFSLPIRPAPTGPLPPTPGSRTPRAGGTGGQSHYDQSYYQGQR